jgi:hypothetical protein
MDVPFAVSAFKPPSAPAGVMEARSAATAKGAAMRVAERERCDIKFLHCMKFGTGNKSPCASLTRQKVARICGVGVTGTCDAALRRR